MKRIVAMGLAALLAGCASLKAPEGADVYSGFTLIDPATETRTENAWLMVKEGRILRFGSGRAPSADAGHRRDFSGRYLMPGFIDAHGHITHTGMVKVDVKDGAVALTQESDDNITPFNARIALARGVTTLRNPGGDPNANARYDAKIASGEWTGPEAKQAGSVIQPPPFGGSSFAYPRNAAEWDAEAKRQAGLGMTYFKLYTSLTEDEIAAGVRAAKAHGLIPIAHLDGVSWARAVDLGVQQLEHALLTSPDLLEPAARQEFLAAKRQDSTFMYRWFELADYNGPLIRGLIATLAEKKIAVDLTLIANEVIYNVDIAIAEIKPARYDADDPTSLMPEIELSDLEAAYPLYPPGSEEFFKAQTRRMATGWTPEDFRRARAVTPKVLAFAKLLHDAGVPMMVGTDGTGGRHYVRELQLHRKAGIPAWDVLRMATSEAADIMGMGGRVGRIATGYEADLVILDGDPVDRIAAAGEVFAVVSNGKLYRAADLRQPGPIPASP
jgi:imidazolonepropionase-like amidohydrolase